MTANQIHDTANKFRPETICSLAYHTNQFSYDRKRLTFSAYASDLHIAPGDVPYVQVYNDACDVGFIVINPDTRHGVIFTLANIDQDEEGDIHGWWFHAQVIVKNTGCKESASQEVKVLIIND